MPKFLDVPYYYGSRGEELSLDLGEQIIQLEDGENTFNVWNFDTGRYRLKAPESISSTLTVNFTVSQYAGTISFTPTMIDVVEAISFEIYPTSWMTMDSVGYFQILFKNTKLSETNGSSNIFSSQVLGDFTMAATLGESFSIQYIRMKNPTGGWTSSGVASFTKFGPAYSINENLKQTYNSQSIYAPTTRGSSGQLLCSGGTTTTPNWKYLYRHNIRINRVSTINNTFVYGLYLNLINFDDTEYSQITSLGMALYSMGYTSINNAYPASGTAWKTGQAAGISVETYNLVGIYASGSSSIYLVIQTLKEGDQDVSGSTIYIASYGPSSFTDNMTAINPAL